MTEPNATKLTRSSLDERNQKMLWVSWSRLYDYTKCEQKAWFKYEGKGEKIRSIRQFIHGTLADRAVRRWLEQKEEQLPGQMDDYIDLMWDEIVENSEDGKVNWKEDVNADKDRVRALAKKTVNNLEPFLFKRVIPYDYQADLRFEVPMQIPDAHGMARTIVLNGAADIVTRDPDTGLLSIYDLKSTENENYVKGPMVAQLIFYEIALHYFLDAPFDNMRVAFLTPACKSQYHELTVGGEDRRHLMSRILRYAHFIWEKQEPTLTDNLNDCFFCEMKKICPRFATVVSDNKRVSLAQTGNQRQKAKAKTK